MTELIRLNDHRAGRGRVYFNRQELARLLNLYSKRVASGHWRDYAIDHMPGKAVFSVFRSSFERPVFAIVKSAQGSRQGEWALMEGKQRLKQARSLDDVLEPLENRPVLVSG